MLNNSMTITDKLKAKIDAEAGNENTPRVKGLRNYANRVAQLSKSKIKERKG